jgi:hypothetical protein
MTKADYLRRSPVRFDEPNYQTCYAYWLELKGERRSPAWSEWDWMALPPRVIPYFLVVDVHYDPLDFVYRFYGTASVSLHAKDFTGLSTKAIRSEATAKITAQQYSEVVTCHEAIGSDYKIQAGIDGPAYIQTSLRMPFSDDGEKVHQIATYVDWSRDHEAIRRSFVDVFGDETEDK